MTKVVFFAFHSDPTCFMHAILNALDLEDKGMWGEIVFEGQSTQLIPLTGNMSAHPPMSDFIKHGYSIITL